MVRLHILWASGDREVAIKVVFPYIIHSKAFGWWEEINLIIWGPSAKLAATDPELERELQVAMDSGVTVEACKACSDSYQVSEHLRSKGITVRYMGAPFTEYVKGDDKLVTF